MSISVSKCFDIAHELEKASIILKAEVKQLSFEVQKVYTFVGSDDNSKNELSPEDSSNFFKSKDYEKEGSFVVQAYDLVIQKAQKAPLFHLELNDDKNQLFLVCKRVDYEEILKQSSEIYAEINAQKALLGVIFQSFSPTPSQNLDAILKQAQDGLGGTKRICLEKSEFFQPVVDASFSFTLQKEWELKNQQSLENSSYAVIEGVEVGRLIKVRYGSDGRNLLGWFIRVEKREPLQSEFGILGDDFEIEDVEDCLIYRSSKAGFVGLNGSGLILIKDFSFEEINHRNIGNLLGGIDYGFTLNIKSSSLDKDAIGAGIVIEAETINVNGSIDQGVILRAKECKVNGLTHQGSEIHAQESAEILTHKGYVKTKNAKIKLCEGGGIECFYLEVEELVGAEVSCQEGVIESLRANNKITFSSKLEIKTMLKGGNVFKIDCSASYEYKEKIILIQKRYQRYMEFIERSALTYKQEAEKLKLRTPIFKRFQTIFTQNIQQGLPTQEYILEAIEQYIQTRDKLMQVKTKIEECQNYAKQIKDELLPMNEIALQAKMICHCEWVDQNQVEYLDLMSNAKEVLVIEDREKVSISIDPRTHKLIKERV